MIPRQSVGRPPRDRATEPRTLPTWPFPGSWPAVAVRVSWLRPAKSKLPVARPHPIISVRLRFNMLPQYAPSVEIARLVLEYLRTLIWPVLLIVVVIAARTRIAELFAKLSGLEASTSGISATFDRSADEAAELTADATRNPVTAPTVDRLVSVRPTSYLAARELGEHLAHGAPVLLDLQDSSEPDSKRLIDFCAGVAFITKGAIERVGSRRFMVYTGPAINDVGSVAPDANPASEPPYPREAQGD